MPYFDRAHFDECRQAHRIAEESGDLQRELMTLTALWQSAEEGKPKRNYARFLHELRLHMGLRTESREQPLAPRSSTAKRPRDDAGASAAARPPEAQALSGQAHASHGAAQRPSADTGAPPPAAPVSADGRWAA
eukprot:1442649-Prymnesium_polylepis.1